MEYCYEESMPLSSSNLDYSLYFIPETLSVFDKLNFIIKKGKPFQRQALLSNIFIYADNINIFSNLLTFIIANIDIWDTTTKMCFPKGLYTTIKSKLFPSMSCYYNLMNIIIKHFFLAIDTFEETVSQEYIYYLEKIITHIITIENGRIILKEEVYELVISLGKFGQKIKNRKICVYLCSCIMRMEQNYDSDLSKNIMNRFILLCGDMERDVKLQISHEFKYVFARYFDVNEEHSELSKILIAYIRNNNDHYIQSETICSVFGFLSKVINHIKEIEYLLINKIKEIVNSEEYEEELICKIIKEIIDNILKEKKNNNINYIEKIVNLIIENNIIEDFIQRCFIKLKEEQNKKKDNINYVDNFSIVTIEGVNKVDIYIDTLLDCFEGICFIFSSSKDKCNYIDDLYTQITSFNYIGINEKHRRKYYEKIHFFITYTSKAILPLLTSDKKDDNNKIMSIFSIKNIDNFLTNKNFPILITVITQSKTHIPIIPLIISNITKLDIDKLNSEHLYNLTTLVPSFKILIPFIYNNSFLTQKTEELYESISSFIKTILSKDKGYHIKSSFIKLIPLLIKYSKNRDNYIKYITDNFSSNGSFYYRRLILPFLEESFNELSIRFHVEKKLWDLYLKGINDVVPCFSCSFIILMKNIYNSTSYNNIGNIALDIIKLKKEKNNLLPIKQRDQQIDETVDSIVEFCKGQETESSNDKDITKYKNEEEIFKKYNGKNHLSLSNSTKFNLKKKVSVEINCLPLKRPNSKGNIKRSNLLSPIKGNNQIVNSKDNFLQEEKNNVINEESSKVLICKPTVFTVKKTNKQGSFIITNKNKNDFTVVPIKNNFKSYNGYSNANWNNNSIKGMRGPPIKFVLRSHNKI